MSRPFEAVREQLLRAGVTPRYAKRYVTELREHLTDLIERERASGLGVEQATDRARALMGADADLVTAAIERGAPRSLAARAPWAIFVLLPLALWLALLSVEILSMMHLLWPVRGLTPADMPQGYRVLIAAATFVARYLLGGLLAAGCVVVALRQRLASGWLWFGVGLIAVLTGMLGIYMHVIPAAAGFPGGTVYSVAAIVYVHGRASLAATLGAWALHAAVLFTLTALAYRVLRARLIPA